MKCHDFKVVLRLYLAAALLLPTLSVRASDIPVTPPLMQNWSNISLVSVTNDWSAVPGLQGFRGDFLAAIPDIDPQTILAGDDPGVLNVTPNKTVPRLWLTGGVTEFELPDPCVALQGSGTAKAPYLKLSLDTSGMHDVRITYNVRDLDDAADNSAQQVALHYRIGASGNFTNVPAAYIADATTGPSLATLVTPVDVLLPAEVNNQSLIQLRIMTSDSSGSDEWVGIDDIIVTAHPNIPAPVTATAATAVSAYDFTANWDAVNDASGYFLDVATTSDFSTLVESYANRAVGSLTSFPISGIEPNSTYYYRVRATTGYGTSVDGNTIALTTRVGKVTGIISHTTPPSLLTAGTDGAGIYQSYDGGDTWQSATIFGNHRITALVVHPENASILYAATFGSGIIKSSDFGANWPDALCTNSGLTDLNVNTLSISDTGTLYAGTEDGIFVSNDCALWTLLDIALPAPVTSILIDPTSTGTLFAGTDGAGIFRKSNDSGWNPVSTQPGNLQVKTLTIKEMTDLYAGTYGGGVFKSNNSGGDWIACSTQPENLNILSLIIDASGRIYAGSETGIFVSGDNCTNWSSINSGLPE